MKTIGLCCDHAGFVLKEQIKCFLQTKGLCYIDYGTFGAKSCDYPDFAHAMALGMEKREADTGVAICGTGNGIAMTLNKHRDIRAAVCWTEEIAALARGHNDANVLVLPGRFISETEAYKCLEAFIQNPFDGGRHQKRVGKIPLL